jgi:colanic acid/amylovoran biosynthesis protein
LIKALPNTRVASDVVFTLKKEQHTVANNMTAVISVIDCSGRFSKEIQDNYENNIVILSKKLIHYGYQITFMSFCKYEGDEKAINRVISRFNKHDIRSVRTYYYKNSVDEAIGHISNCEIVVGTRFHACILGFIFNKKVLPIIYSDKTKNILDDMHFDGPTLDIRKPNPSELTDFKIRDLKIFNVDKQVKLAEKQFQELDKILVRRKNINE